MANNDLSKANDLSGAVHNFAVLIFVSGLLAAFILPAVYPVNVSKYSDGDYNFVLLVYIAISSSISFFLLEVCSKLIRIFEDILQELRSTRINQPSPVSSAADSSNSLPTQIYNQPISPDDSNSQRRKDGSLF